MAGYATQQDLIDRFGDAELIQLTDKVNRPATTIDATTVTAALDDATDLIDSYIAKKYALPITTPPAILTRVCAEIARYYLHGRRTEKDDPVTRDYANAVAWLKDVAKGLVQLEAEGVDTPAAGGSTVRRENPDRVFSRDSLKGFG